MVEGSFSLLKNVVMNLILSNFVIKSIMKIEDMEALELKSLWQKCSIVEFWSHIKSDRNA